MADTDAVIDLLVAGELCVDIVIGLDGGIRFGQHEQIVRSTTLTLGSSSAITACGAAALGARVSMAGVRGDDDFGAFIQRELSSRGVEVGAVRVDRAVPTGASTHLTRPDGDRAILTSMGSIGRTAASDVVPLLDRARHLHVGSWFLQESLWDDAPAVFALARSAGMTTSLDGNFDPAQRWDSGILTLLPHVDVFFGNEQEVTGIAREGEPERAVRMLLDRMPHGATVVYKLGADGAAAYTLADGALDVAHASTPEIGGALVDTVGAGDTLAAGYLVARLDGVDRAGALAFAVACGTASTRGAGGVGGQPDRARASALAAHVCVR